ncbi:MAG: competence/damage-inducible protein CinA C-terminal domain [Chloroflexi bacterium]|jgi:PncC family amidohydrolase|nr:competence/damage-inducible protein CinA C-terminal domain [Chloroflexota bacterium]MDB5077799.1 competence/damage-inducible protein CinA C-terminal domain [Chloroflexota bacterium]
MNWHEDVTLTTVAAEIAQQAIHGGITIATAESCTGGLVAQLLTRTSGVSAVFMGGIVAYSNEAKHELLGVNEDLLRTHGAVSDPVARAMALGARERFHVALAVSTTGVAGPGGGSDLKPVGLTYVAVRGDSIDICERFVFEGDRAENVMSAAWEALRALSGTLSSLMG